MHISKGLLSASAAAALAVSLGLSPAVASVKQLNVPTSSSTASNILTDLIPSSWYTLSVNFTNTLGGSFKVNEILNALNVQLLGGGVLAHNSPTLLIASFQAPASGSPNLFFAEKSLLGGTVSISSATLTGSFAVPGPTAGAGLAGLVLAGLGFLMVRRSKAT